MEAVQSCLLEPDKMGKPGETRSPEPQDRVLGSGLGIQWAGRQEVRAGGRKGVHSRAAPQVRVVYLVTQAQPQLAALFSQGPHGLPHCSSQHPKSLCGDKGQVSTRKQP